MRGRRITAFLAAGLLVLVAAGCGGGDELAPEVPGPPADVVISESADAPSAAASKQDENGTTDESGTDSTDTGTTDDTGTTTPDTSGGATAPEGTTPDASGGTTAPDTSADGPTNDTPPPEGSNAEQFEDFCAQNPGAC